MYCWELHSMRDITEIVRNGAGEAGDEVVMAVGATTDHQALLVKALG